MATVYRYEHPLSGDGPYAGRSDFTMALCAAHQGTRPPGPEDVGLPWRRGRGLLRFSDHRFIFGTSTRDQMTRWFGPFEAALRLHGYRLFRYTVPDDAVLYGSQQVAFDSERVIKRQEVNG